MPENIKNGEKTMKKVIALLLAAASCVTILASCGNTEEPTETKAETTASDETEVKTPDYIVLEEDFGAEEYAIGFRKNDYALAAKMQEILDEMGKDGTAGKIAEKWFGNADAFLTGKEFPREMKEPDGDSSLSYVLDKKTIILGLDETFPPMGFRDSKTNEIIGFDIDLAKEAASRLGVELILQPIDWDSKELELNNKKIDMIWNGMSITDERIEEMFLSKPYVANAQVIIVSKDSDIKAKKDLAGKTVGLQKGSSALDAVKADEDVFKSIGNIAEYEENVSAYLDLKAGRIDAFVVDKVVGEWIIVNN